MHSEQFIIMLDKVGIFTNKYVDAQLSTFKQKKIKKLLEKDVFNIVMLEEVPSST